MGAVWQRAKEVAKAVDIESWAKLLVVRMVFAPRNQDQVRRSDQERVSWSKRCDGTKKGPNAQCEWEESRVFDLAWGWCRGASEKNRGQLLVGHSNESCAWT